jgi:BirA family biotin operon repressor/biotin-[acetyl-CoA-carboxylase] ligase
VSEDLAARLRAGTRFAQLLHLGSCASTQDEALRLRGEACVWADEQTAGRGRRGRAWLGAAGQDVEVTFRVEAFAPPRPELVAPAVPAAILVALESLCGVRLTFKWPNDILHRGRKLCGILIDVHGGRAPVWLFGIGVDVNRLRFPPELAQAATSLALLAGHPLDRAEVVARLAVALDRALEALAEGRTGALAQVFRERLGLVGRRVRIEVAGGPPRIGIVEALDLDGICLAGAAPLPLARVEGLWPFDPA